MTRSLNFFHNRAHGMFCQSRPLAHDSVMKLSLWHILSCTLALFMVACSNMGDVASSDHPTGTGPFDANGNYREEWADDPSKWRRPGQASSDDAAVVAKNEQPPADSTPLASSAPTRSKPETKSVKVAVSKTQEPERAKKTSPASETPKPSVVIKTKPKPKAASTRYTVKKGDTLSGIASRHGTSVSAIKSANRISGTMIRDGQKLVIPKR